MTKMTTHMEFDVDDERVGVIQRFLASQNVDNLNVQPNGLKARKGSLPTRMNGAKIEDVVAHLFGANGGANIDRQTMTTSVKLAGFEEHSLNGALNKLTEAKMIKRIGRGVYGLGPNAPKPAPRLTHRGGVK